jgi:hypothetical protein
MALRKSSQRRSASAAAKATAAITTADIAGTYAYKFGGYVNLQIRPWWLAGLGKFTIESSKGNQPAKVTGSHRSSIMPIRGQTPDLLTATWDLDGTIYVGSDGTGTASILFTKVDKVITPLPQLRGEFYVVVPAMDRLWLISAGAMLMAGGNKVRPAHESVHIEAVRVPY